MAFLQAYVDDSAGKSGDQRLYMAGYLQRAEKWALFSEAWDEELREAPSIDYFKMSEAIKFDGQFLGWSDLARDEKLRGLARVICHFRPMSFEFSVSREQYYRIVRPVAPRGINPHFVCCFGIVAGLSRYVADHKVKSPIDFIFDQQDGVDADISLFFEHMKKNLPRGARNLISSTPTFRNDKLFLPLQAADMLAWHVRREHEEYGSLGGNMPLADLLRNGDGHLMSELDETILRSWADQFSKLPGIDKMKSQKQWQALKAEVARASALGFIPPHGTRWKNAFYGARARFGRFFRR